MRIHKLAAAALLGVAALGVSGCATSLPTKVTRYSVAIPQGQSFYVVPAQGVQPGLEFNRYAALVAQQMAARGYQQAASTAAADMLIKVGYGVDEGTQEVQRRSVRPVALLQPLLPRLLTTRFTAATTAGPTGRVTAIGGYPLALLLGLGRPVLV